MNRLSKNEGITLIELALTVSIMSLVLLLMFTFFQFNYSAFNRSNDKYNIQTSLVNASRVIEEELKFATYVRIHKTKPPEKLNSNYLGKEGNVIKINGKEITDKEIVSVKNLSFELHDNFILFSIEGASLDGKLSYSIDAAVELLNFENNTDNNEVTNQTMTGVEEDTFSFVEYTILKGDD